MKETESKVDQCESCGFVRTITKIQLISGDPNSETWLCGTCIYDEFYYDEG